MTQWPRLGVGGVVIHDGRVLLVRRLRPPSAGLWAIPGGKVEAGETLSEAVQRELFEECGIEVEPGELVYQFEFIEHDDTGLKYHYVVLDFTAKYCGGEARAGDDAAEVAWLDARQIRTLPVHPNTLQLLQQTGFLSE